MFALLGGGGTASAFGSDFAAGVSVVHLAVEESGHVWTAVVMLQLGLYFPIDLAGTVGGWNDDEGGGVPPAWRDSVLLKWGQVEATFVGGRKLAFADPGTAGGAYRIQQGLTCQWALGVGFLHQ